MRKSLSRGRNGLVASLAIGLTLVSTMAFAMPTAAQRAAVKASCTSDFMSYCSGVSPGGLPALQCLQKNVSKLSPDCQAAVQAIN